MTLKISWTEADGTEKFDIDPLGQLLEHDLKLLKGPRGEALLLREVDRSAAVPHTLWARVRLPKAD